MKRARMTVDTEGVVKDSVELTNEQIANEIHELLTWLLGVPVAYGGLGLQDPKVCVVVGDL